MLMRQVILMLGICTLAMARPHKRVALADKRVIIDTWLAKRSLTLTAQARPAVGYHTGFIPMPSYVQPDGNIKIVHGNSQVHVQQPHVQISQPIAEESSSGFLGFLKKPLNAVGNIVDKTGDVVSNIVSLPFSAARQVVSGVGLEDTGVGRLATGILNVGEGIVKTPVDAVLDVAELPFRAAADLVGGEDQSVIPQVQVRLPSVQISQPVAQEQESSSGGLLSILQKPLTAVGDIVQETGDVVSDIVHLPFSAVKEVVSGVGLEDTGIGKLATGILNVGEGVVQTPVKVVLDVAELPFRAAADVVGALDGSGSRQVEVQLPQVQISQPIALEGSSGGLLSVLQKPLTAVGNIVEKTGDVASGIVHLPFDAAREVVSGVGLEDTGVGKLATGILNVGEGIVQAPVKVVADVAELPFRAAADVVGALEGSGGVQVGVQLPSVEISQPISLEGSGGGLLSILQKPLTAVGNIVEKTGDVASEIVHLPFDAAREVVSGVGLEDTGVGKLATGILNVGEGIVQTPVNVVADVAELPFRAAADVVGALEGSGGVQVGVQLPSVEISQPIFLEGSGGGLLSVLQKPLTAVGNIVEKTGDVASEIVHLPFEAAREVVSGVGLEDTGVGRLATGVVNVGEGIEQTKLNILSKVAQAPFRIGAKIAGALDEE